MDVVVAPPRTRDIDLLAPADTCGARPQGEEPHQGLCDCWDKEPRLNLKERLRSAIAMAWLYSATAWLGK